MMMLQKKEEKMILCQLLPSRIVIIIIIISTTTTHIFAFLTMNFFLFLENVLHTPNEVHNSITRQGTSRQSCLPNLMFTSFIHFVLLLPIDDLHWHICHAFVFFFSLHLILVGIDRRTTRDTSTRSSH